MYPFKLKSAYSFNTLAPSVLGASIKNAKVLGIIDYDIATTLINVELMQRSIYPLLPQGTVDSPASYTFLLLLTESGVKTAIAYEWIDPASIELVESVTITVSIPNVKVSDANVIRDALTLSGFTGFSIKTS